MHIGDILDSSPNVNRSNVIRETSSNVNVTNVRNIAQKLMDTLHDPASYDYFLRVGWHLPESRIWLHLEQARTGRNPAAYFIWLCERDLT